MCNTTSQEVLKFQYNLDVSKVRLQRWARIRTAANFGGFRTGSDCNFFEVGGSGLDRIEKRFVIL